MDEEEKEEGLFVHATCEGEDVPQVTFEDDSLVAVAVAEARPSPDEYKTDSGNDFPDREDRKILRLLPFQDLGGQYLPIFGLICKVRL